jgi:hypothetical protein
VQHPWDQHAVALEADVGGAKFAGNTFEYAQGPAAKAVCVNFLQWSSQHPHIARIVVQYSTGAPGTVATPEASDAPNALETAIAGPDPFSSASPAAALTSSAANPF